MIKTFILILAAVALLAGCNKKPTEVPVETARLGTITGTTGALYIQENFPNATLNTYDTLLETFTALQNNELDYVVTSHTNALGFIRTNKDLEIIEGNLFREGAAIAVNKNETKLFDDISIVLQRFSVDDTLDSIIDNWIRDDGSDYIRSDIPKNSNGEILKVGIDASLEPLIFIKDGQFIGLDCDLIELIAYEIGMIVEYTNMEFHELIAAVESGKVSVAISNITNTETRRDKVDFTQDYFHNPQILVKNRSK